MKITSFICLIIFLAFIASCITEVKLNLPSDKRLVVNGYLIADLDKGGAREQSVVLDWSKDYYEGNVSTRIRDAEVVIEEEESDKTYKMTFNEDRETYTSVFEVLPDKTYILKIKHNNTDYEAKDKAPSSKSSIKAARIEYIKLLIDTIRPAVLSSPIPTVVIVFQDSKEEVNYYDFDLKVNGEFLALDQRMTRLTRAINDKGFNGDSVRQVIGYMNTQYQKGDQLEIQVLHISKFNYEFEKAMNNLANSGGGGLTTPAKPSIVGNIENKNNPDKPGLGFFKVVGAKTGTLTFP